MRVLGVIPARLGSIRLPNKPLQLLAGEPLITRVIQRVMEHDLTDELVVATDSQRGGGRGGGRGSEGGADRPLRICRERTVWPRSRPGPSSPRREIVVNVQGDEPFLAS